MSEADQGDRAGGASVTTPGGVLSLPHAALTLDTIASKLQDMSGTAMKNRAVERFPSIFNNSTGLNPALDFTPFGILTRVWAEANSVIANADPNDIQTPDDIPELLLEFIEGLPLVGQFVDLLEAITGTYDGEDPTLLIVQEIFGPIRALVNALQGIDTSSPEAFITSLIDALINGGLEAVTDWAAIGARLFGIPGLDEAGVGTAGSRLMALLGNPVLGGGSFDPIKAGEGMLQDVLTPAGAVTSFTQIPAHLFGNLNTARASQNLLPDGSFDDPNSLSGLDMFAWSSVGRTKPGSAQTTAVGVLRQLIGVPIAAVPGDITDVSTYAKWSGVTASAGSAIVLAVNAYNAGDVLIPDPDNRVIAAITTPGVSSLGYAGADANGWVALSGSYQAPAGTAYLRMSLEVAANVTAGTAWFDDCSQSLQTGLIDAGILKNVENMPGLPPEVVKGVEGLIDLANTLQHLKDGLGSAYHDGGAVDGIGFNELFLLAQTSTQNTAVAFSKAVQAIVTLGNRTNKPTAAGVNPTSEAMFSIGHFSSGGTLTTSSLAAGNAISQMFRAGEDAKKGFIEFFAGGSGVTNIFLNAYSVNPTTKTRTLLWTSSNLAPSIPTTPNYVRALIPGGSQPVVLASDLLQLELVNAGANALTVVTKNTGVPNHPTDFPNNYGATRVTASTGGTSPASLTDGQVTYSGVVPYMNFGISDVPADYHAPDSATYSTGSYSLTLPAWLRAGDKVDLIGIGGGGGGGGSVFYFSGQGGGAATWDRITLTVGTDVKIGSTLTIVVGAGGSPGSAGNNGGNGGNTTVTYLDPSNNPHTITFLGGPYGGPGPSHNGANPNSSSSGQAAGNTDYNGKTYFGGGEVSLGNTGSSPGGGGGGAIPYLNGSTGGRGELNVVARQAA